MSSLLTALSVNTTNSIEFMGYCFGYYLPKNTNPQITTAEYLSEQIQAHEILKHAFNNPLLLPAVQAAYENK